MAWFDDHLMRPESAGLLGAALGWLNAPGGSWRVQAFNLLGGLGAAVYVAPWLAEAASIKSASGQLAFAFLLGLVGMNVLAKLIAAAKKISREEILDVLTRVVGK